RMVQKGDIIIIIGYGIFEESEARTYKADLVFVDANNRILETRKG
ncbi:MAG: aspartate 1-decarboxylase, partial [Syntrophomonadaceae bacterium]|nr:aspartate 1-decarboxylase [Syntrophomonadaceae bacterium]